MRCSKCQREWKLSGGDGTIGQAEPGQFMIVTVILAFIAGVLVIKFQSWGAAAMDLIALCYSPGRVRVPGQGRRLPGVGVSRVR